MTETNDLDLMLSALTEIMEEEKAKNVTPLPSSTPALPTLCQVLHRLAPLPQEALFLGMANDGLPVLLNLYDPVPGPILIAGDKSSGKTKLLQTIARAAELLHSPDVAQYVIVTSKPDEWETSYNSESNAGIYKVGEKNTGELFEALVKWAHNNRGNGQSILVLIDDLDTLINSTEPTQQNLLRWLLLRGPSRRIWLFITLNAQDVENQKEWLESFRTRLFGFVENADQALLLTGDQSLDHLSASNEFAMREGNQLLKFWLPRMD
ncbi:MAG: NACHT domain-containing protein [Anaerolineales bacterium]